MGLGVNKPSNDSLRSSKAVCRLFDVERDEKTEGGWFWSRLAPRTPSALPQLQAAQCDASRMLRASARLFHVMHADFT